MKGTLASRGFACVKSVCKAQRCPDYYYFVFVNLDLGLLESPWLLWMSYVLKVLFLGPGWCGSVDWVLACKPKGHWFDSQSGHMPGLQARSLVGGAWEATTHWCFSPCLSPSLPLSLRINKIKSFFKKKFYCLWFKHIFL